MMREEQANTAFLRNNNNQSVPEFIISRFDSRKYTLIQTTTLKIQ